MIPALFLSRTGYTSSAQSFGNSIKGPARGKHGLLLGVTCDLGYYTRRIGRLWLPPDSASSYLGLKAPINGQLSASTKGNFLETLNGLAKKLVKKDLSRMRLVWSDIPGNQRKRLKPLLTSLRAYFPKSILPRYKPPSVYLTLELNCSVSAKKKVGLELETGTNMQWTNP